MSATASFPRSLVLAGSILLGVLLALAVHMLGLAIGLDLSGLWTGGADLVPVGAALAWWLIASVSFVAGYATATMLDKAAAGHIPSRLWQVLIGIGVLLLAGAGQSATSSQVMPTAAMVGAGLTALVLGGVMAFCGATFALRQARATSTR